MRKALSRTATRALIVAPRFPLEVTCTPPNRTTLAPRMAIAGSVVTGSMLSSLQFVKKISFVFDPVSAMAVPAWMLLQRPLGTRNLWFLAAGACIAGLASFAVVEIADIHAMQIFLVAMQAAIVGLHFAFWAMLPNTIEYGEQATGLRVEGTVFGAAALRIRGLYLAISTLAMQYIIDFTIGHVPAISGGTQAVLSTPPLTLFGMRVGTGAGEYYVALAVCVAEAVWVLKA